MAPAGLPFTGWAVVLTVAGAGSSVRTTRICDVRFNTRAPIPRDRARIRFSVGAQQYIGEVAGRTMQGTVGGQAWSASRSGG